MINKLRYGAAGAAFAVALGMSPAAQAADNANATATAEILSSLTLDVAAGTSLDFGQMVLPNTNGGAVSLSAGGVLDCSDPDIVCSGTTGVPTFNITTGTPNKAVTVSLPTSASTLLRVGGTSGVTQDEIVLDTFTTSAATLNLDGTGAGSFTVGGTITLDGDETPGVFNGTFNVSVAYS